MKPRTVSPPPPALIGLLFGTGALAVIFGLGLLISNGRWLGLDQVLLEPSPFDSYHLPGLLLAGLVGGSQITAGLAVRRRRRNHRTLAVVAAAILGAWMGIQALMLGMSWLVPVIFIVAIVEVGLVASSLPRTSPGSGKQRKRR